MNLKLFPIFILLVIIISPFVKSTDLHISLNPRFYIGEEEVTSSWNFTKISLDVVAQNTNPKFPIFNLTLRTVAPHEFREALSNESFVLGVGETRTAQILDLRELSTRLQTSQSQDTELRRI